MDCLVAERPSPLVGNVETSMYMKMLHEEAADEVTIISDTLREMVAAIQKQAWVFDSTQGENECSASKDMAFRRIDIVRAFEPRDSARAFVQADVHQV